MNTMTFFFLFISVYDISTLLLGDFEDEKELYIPIYKWVYVIVDLNSQKKKVKIS